jgi:dihydrodipicolinate synthase/N-acetylneuraminate lyase
MNPDCWPLSASSALAALDEIGASLLATTPNYFSRFNIEKWPARITAIERSVDYPLLNYAAVTRPFCLRRSR